jgi:tetratricopeptide (TPR) repeat protein
MNQLPLQDVLAPAYSALIQRVLALPSKRHDKRLVHFLTRPEIEALLAAPDRTTWIERRNYALLLLAVQTGLRLSELTGLDRDAVVLGRGAHVRCFGKGRKERCTPLTEHTIHVMQAWLKDPSRNSSQALFPNLSGGRLSPDAVQARPAQAIPAYNRALAIIPKDSDTRVDLAVTLEQLGDKEGAEREFKKALGFAPKNISALNDLGSLLIVEGRLDEAIPYFEQAIQANPRDKNAYYDLGGISQQRGQMEKALAYYQKVLQIDPTDQEARLCCINPHVVVWSR